jgi:hypothetical protein
MQVGVWSGGGLMCARAWMIGFLKPSADENETGEWRSAGFRQSKSRTCEDVSGLFSLDKYLEV